MVMGVGIRFSKYYIQVGVAPSWLVCTNQLRGKRCHISAPISTRSLYKITFFLSFVV